MKGLNKIALVTAIAAAPFAAHAELQVMDDAAMSAATGQAGLTIAIRDINISGIDTTITIDVAGASDAGTFTAAAGGSAIADGDLVISLSETDFNMSVGNVSLEQEAYALGSAVAADATVLVSNIDLEGQIGGVNVVIHEATGDMDIAATFNAQRSATAVGGLKFDFLNVEIGDFKIGNMRGTDAGNSSNGLGYATVDMTISTETAPGVAAKGLFIDVRDFSADIDMTDIAIGGNSIGSLYITDLAVTATMDVYGH